MLGVDPFYSPLVVAQPAVGLAGEGDLADRVWLTASLMRDYCYRRWEHLKDLMAGQVVVSQWIVGSWFVGAGVDRFVGVPVP